MHCPKCHSAKVIKSGYVTGKQRYNCKSCNYYFTLNNKGVSKEDKKLAFHLYLEGFSMREISTILDNSDVAVGKWIKPVKEYLLPVRKRKVQKVDLHQIEHFLISRELFKQFGWLLIGLEENKDICLFGSKEVGNCKIIEK